MKNLKICIDCKKQKPLEDFYKRNTRGYISSYCSQCEKIRRKKYYHRHRKEENRKCIEWKAKNKDRVKRIQNSWYKKNGRTYYDSLDRRFASYKAEAKFRNIDFSITLEQFTEFWQKSCYYCNEEISTIGLDRVNNSIGYSINNIVPCCTICNQMKRKQTQQEFISRCKKIAKYNAEAFASWKN